MNGDTVVSVTSLYKKFCRDLRSSLFYGSIDVAKGMLGRDYDSGILRKGEFWALKDINFKLSRGQALGVIGQNGSGKTTLLRLINGIYPPDRGRIEIRGNIGALMAIGAGFHPHMTGRENIFISGTVLGIPKKEIKKKVDSIIDFADIGEFIDSPVATYSSGMSVRLGFAIAIQALPEILLADEVLAVGDLSFALKCHRKISEYKENGGSIILVSHGMQIIRNTCENVIWLDDGKIREYGKPQTVCDHYEKSMLTKDEKLTKKDERGSHVNNDPGTQITRVTFLDGNGEKAGMMVSGDDLRMKVDYLFRRQVRKPIFTLGIHNAEGILITGNNSNLDMEEPIKELSGEGFITIRIKNFYLKPGSYVCTLTLSEGNATNVLDWHEKRFPFTVGPGKNTAFGLWQERAEWKF